MPTKDISAGVAFDAGDTAPTVRSKLNANLAWTESAIQGVEDRLESSLAGALGDGVVSGLGVAAGSGLTATVASGTAVIGFAVTCAGGTVAVPASSVSAVRLTQSGALDVRPAEDSPPSERSVLLATVIAGSESVSSVDNAPEGRTPVTLLSGWDGPDAPPVAETLIAFDPQQGHRHDGADARALVGTPSAAFAIGDGTDTTVALLANNADATKPGLRYSHAADRWEYSNDGAAWNAVGSGGGAGTPSDSVAAATSYGAPSSAGIASSYSRGDHTHGTPALGGDPPTAIAAGIEGGAGAGALPARQDHAHAISTAAPGGAFGTFAFEGSSSGLARADHVHAAFDAAPPVNVAPLAATGVSSCVARRDHAHAGVHSIARSGDSQLVGDVVLAAGGNVTLSQSGQTITIASAGGSGSLGDSVANETAFGVAANAGSSTSASRSDHTHGTPSTPVTSLAKQGASALTGAVTLSAGANVTLTQAGQDIEVAADDPTPAGSDREVQFHDGGALGASSALQFNKTTRAISVGDSGTSVGHYLNGIGAIARCYDAPGAVSALRQSAASIVANDILGQFVGWGQVTGWTTVNAGSMVRFLATEAWTEGAHAGSRAEVWVVANGGTSPARAACFDQDLRTTLFGALSVGAGGSMGGASTDVFDFTGRVRFRTTATNPTDATPASRPAGSVGEIAYYSGGWYVCTDAGTPQWSKVALNSNGVSFTTIQASSTVTLSGNCTFGDASADTITCNGRLVLRDLTSDPMHATAGSRPSGSAREVAHYQGALYVCRNATTPEWARTGSTRSVSFSVVGTDTDVTAGDGKYAYCVPSDLAGWNLVGATARVYTAGATNTTDVQLRRSRDTAGTPRTSTDADMLSTKLAIDPGEVCSTTAATAAVINTSQDDVQEGDLILIDVDAVSTTAPKGLSVALVSAMPAP